MKSPKKPDRWEPPPLDPRKFIDPFDPEHALYPDEVWRKKRIKKKQIRQSR